MSVDPFLPDSTFPAAEGQCYLVRGRRVGAFVEISLSHDRDEKHRFRSDTYAPIEELAFKRFRHDDTPAYTAHADRLEDAAGRTRSATDEPRACGQPYRSSEGRVSSRR